MISVKVMVVSRTHCYLPPLVSHTHSRLTALFPGLPGWAGTRKVKPIWILVKQETVSGNGISWAMCKSAPCSRQITVPAPHSRESLWVYRPLGRCPSYYVFLRVKSAPSSVGTLPPYNTWFHWPHDATPRDGFSIGSSIFAGFTVVTSRQTDTRTTLLPPSVGIGRVMPNC